MVDFKGSIFKIEKVLVVEFVCSASASICCVMNCC
jgi:hypothetical protein